MGTEVDDLVCGATKKLHYGVSLSRIKLRVKRGDEFERTRLECHPQSADVESVLLGLVRPTFPDKQVFKSISSIVWTHRTNSIPALPEESEENARFCPKFGSCGLYLVFPLSDPRHVAMRVGECSMYLFKRLTWMTFLTSIYSDSSR